ncbi:hypothetical protein ABZ642_35010 [Streptomyces sp. NPDC007157]|uniref:hypothetical protein n=1 Tax=Streptomyces sp. NPDC007157 TaxID=3154681 RepID=UPI0033DF06DD
MTATVYPTPIPGSTPSSKPLRLMAVGRDRLRTSHVDRLMVEAARLRTVSEADPAGQAAWDSEEDQEVRDPAARPQIPVVYVPPTAR